MENFEGAQSQFQQSVITAAIKCAQSHRTQPRLEQNLKIVGVWWPSQVEEVGVKKK